MPSNRITRYFEPLVEFVFFRQVRFLRFAVSVSDKFLIFTFVVFLCAFAVFGRIYRATVRVPDGIEEALGRFGPLLNAALGPGTFPGTIAVAEIKNSAPACLSKTDSVSLKKNTETLLSARNEWQLAETDGLMSESSDLSAGFSADYVCRVTITHGAENSCEMRVVITDSRERTVVSSRQAFETAWKRVFADKLLLFSVALRRISAWILFLTVFSFCAKKTLLVLSKKVALRYSHLLTEKLMKLKNSGDPVYAVMLAGFYEPFSSEPGILRAFINNLTAKKTV